LLSLSLCSYFGMKGINVYLSMFPSQLMLFSESFKFSSSWFFISMRMFLLLRECLAVSWPCMLYIRDIYCCSCRFGLGVLSLSGFSLNKACIFYVFFLMISLVVFIWLGRATPVGSGSYPNHLLFYPWLFLLFREYVPFVSLFVLYSGFLWVPEL
jgi:hypothetical protein